MYYVLYNDKSNHGKAIKVAIKLYKKLSKKYETKLISVFDILGNEKEFNAKMTENDSVVIVGGDGTFHEFVNRIQPNKVICRVYALASGRGNDFSRDYNRHKMFEITHLINDLPTLTINGKQNIKFVNGVGMGVDAAVCYEQAKNVLSGIKKSYFKIALSAFKSFKPYTLDIEIDGELKHFENVWLFVCNNGKYFGGGMKITPKAIREDDLLDICIVHSVPIRKLVCIFPTIFLGKHIWFKKYVTTFTGKCIRVKSISYNILQRDGEVSEGVNEIEVRR